MKLFTGLEQFFEELPSLISQARRLLHSDNINILEHFERKLQDAFDVLKRGATWLIICRKIHIKSLFNYFNRKYFCERSFGESV